MPPPPYLEKSHESSKIIEMSLKGVAVGWRRRKRKATTVVAVGVKNVASKGRSNNNSTMIGLWPFARGGSRRKKKGWTFSLSKSKFSTPWLNLAMASNWFIYSSMYFFFRVKQNDLLIKRGRWNHPVHIHSN